tara:strand:+ start:31983 stop:32396 length:414 start_codon:yes stop_codon:yes gene_type:complete
MTKFDYSTLLKEAKAKLPEIKQTTERFEIPKVTGHVQGNKTIIVNFSKICTVLRREPSQVIKYLQRELATPASADGQRLVLGRKITSSVINEKIAKYAKEFVLCKECGKPDTKILREERISSLKCLACGAKHPIKAK